jgi:threonine dehydrogenase-like Zn-dependent dehydrogenase
MQALVWHGPWELTVEQVSDPQPAAGEVLVRIEATGICGSDIHGFSGATGRRSPGQVMGHETVGRVTAVGADVDPARGLNPGALVTVNPVIACGECTACASGREQACQHQRVIGVAPDIVSAFAQFLVAPEANVIRLPESMPVEYGVLVEPLSVGYHAARRGDCTAKDAVLVIGGGPIGQACILAAQRLGATRIAVTEPNPTRRELAASLGAIGIDPTGGDPAGDIVAALGEPASLVLDAVGNSRSLADAMGYSNLGARVVLVGMNTPKIELPAYAISTEERTLVGTFCYSAADFQATAEWVGQAPAVLTRLVDGRVDLSGAPAAFAELAKGESTASKVLVYPHGIPAAAGL